MGLSTPTGALGEPVRRLRNVTKSPAKLDVSVAPGDELIVSEDLAAQLEATRQFADVGSDREQAATPGLEAAAEAERERLAELAVEEAAKSDGLITPAEARAVEAAAKPAKRPRNRNR